MHLSPLSLLRLSSSYLKLVQDPRKLDSVISMADKLSDPCLLEEITTAIKTDPRSAASFIDKPRLGRIDFDALEALSDGTLGREYARFHRTPKSDPNALPVRPADNDGDYALAHLYETHDIWHTVLGFSSEVPGELGLLAFYFAQFPGRLSPMLLSAGLMNTAARQIDEKDQRMDAIVRGWLLGKRTPSLFGVRWTELWEQPLEEVRASLGIRLAEVDELVHAA